MCRKLDLNGVRVYTNTKADVRDAIDLVGERVYLSDDVTFESYEEAELAEVNYTNDIAYPFFGGNGEGWFKYIIRAEDVKFKDEEKAYEIFRPYESIDEFCSETGCKEVGIDRITIRNKNRKQECVLLYTGYSEDAVHLGGYVLTFETLVKHYEFYNKCGEWKPFGMEE